MKELIDNPVQCIGVSDKEVSRMHYQILLYPAMSLNDTEVRKKKQQIQSAKQPN